MQRSVSVPKGNIKKEGSKLQNNGVREYVGFKIGKLTPPERKPKLKYLKHENVWSTGTLLKCGSQFVQARLRPKDVMSRW